MTTLAAVQGPSWVVMGYDSRVVETDGRNYALPKNAGKCVQVGDYFIGVAGDFRAVNIISYTFSPPPAPHSKDSVIELDKFMISKFVPAVKRCFDANFYGKDNEHGSLLMVAVSGVLYEIGENYDCIRDDNGLYALGSGGPYALGALYGMEDGSRRSIKRAREMVTRAMEVAVHLDSGSSDPVSIIVQRRDS